MPEQREVQDHPRIVAGFCRERLPSRRTQQRGSAAIENDSRVLDRVFTRTLKFYRLPRCTGEDEHPDEPNDDAISDEQRPNVARCSTQKALRSGFTSNGIRAGVASVETV
jgi:hypothetical protein